MPRFSFLLVLLACVVTASCQTDRQAPSEDVLNHVNLFIGTGAHGHTFPGPVMPHGMVQLSPDTRLPGWDASSGYHYSDSTIYGFSHTHLSGTGIGDMGDILFLPYTGPVEDTLLATFDKSNEFAEVGRYQVRFNNFDVQAELTVTERTGIHRYTYDDVNDKKLLVDVGHILQANWGHQSVEGWLEFIDDRTMRGYRKSSGWAYDHPVYFYAEFSEPYRVEKVADRENDVSGYRVEGAHLKAWLAFDEATTNEVVIKVGISPVRIEGAQMNLEAEAEGWDFDEYVASARQVWRKAISQISIDAVDESVLTNFYTGLYRTRIAPLLAQDVDGNYRSMDKAIRLAQRGYTNYTAFSLWDTYRALHPLMTIIDAEKTGLWAEGLIRKFEEGGLLPKWPLASNYTGTMIGYPAVSVLADAMSKGLLDDIKPARILEAAHAGSRYIPRVAANHAEPRASRVTPVHLKYVAELGFIPADSVGGSVSYGLENAYYDWCISVIARIAGYDSMANQYAQRALNYRAYFDKESGFMRAKRGDGTWKAPFNPYYSDHENSEYIEGNAWQWSWSVQHDAKGLVELFGGEDAFVAQLDSLFSARTEVEGENASGDITGLIGQYAHGNEPSHHIAYFYNKAGQPTKMQDVLDTILQEFYLPIPEGIIGNEDCGQMSAWYVLNAIGFYQVTPGKPEYTIGRPLINKAEIKLENGNTFRIEVENNSLQNKYVVSATMNERPLDTLTFSHEDIVGGGVLRIVMAEESQ